METTSKFFGTKNNERNGYHSARKETRINRRIFIMTLIVLTLLFFGKVIMSGLYLRLGPMILSNTNIAMAEEDDVDMEQALKLKEQMLKKKELVKGKKTWSLFKTRLTPNSMN